MRNLHLLAAVALFMVGLAGCEKATVQNEASTDVFVKAIKNAGGTTVYAPIHSVFSYNKMASVVVTAPGGATLALNNFEDGGLSFFNEPTDAEYLTTAPTGGVYSYKVTFDDGEEKTYTNSLAATKLEPATITSLVKSADGDSVYISWNAVTSTHAYQLKVEKGTTQVFYQPAFADGSVPPKPTLRIGLPLTKLTSNGAGVYTFVLTGLLFETTAYDYLQAISTSTKDIVL